MSLFNLGRKDKKAMPPRSAIDNDMAVTAPAAPPDFIAKNLLTVFKQAYADTRGVHVETVLSTLGAMAGFGCQVVVREAAKAGKIDTRTALVLIETKDGAKFYFGDQLNQPLIEAPVSVFKLVAGAAASLGKPVPDIREIARFVAETIGTPQFGTLRVAPEHQPRETPFEGLKKQWASAYRLVKAQHDDPLMTGWYFALAAQGLIIEAKDVLDRPLP